MSKTTLPTLNFYVLYVFIFSTLVESTLIKGYHEDLKLPNYLGSKTCTIHVYVFGSNFFQRDNFQAFIFLNKETSLYTINSVYSDFEVIQYPVGPSI